MNRHIEQWRRNECANGGNVFLRDGNGVQCSLCAGERFDSMKVEWIFCVFIFCRAITNWRRRYFERNYYMRRDLKCNATMVLRVADVWNAGTKPIRRAKRSIFFSPILQLPFAWLSFSVSRSCTTHLIAWNRVKNGKFTYANTSATTQAPMAFETLPNCLAKVIKYSAKWCVLQTSQTSRNLVFW